MFVEAPYFPHEIAWGATGGARFSTDVLQQYDGTEHRNRNWRRPIGVWDVGSIHRTHAEILLLLEFFYAVARGALYGFRFKDFTDFRFDNILGTGDGVKQDFQLVKVYNFGHFVQTRTLYKPVAGTLVMSVDGVVREDYDVDFTTGLVTFMTPPASGTLVTGAGEFDVPARFVQDHLPVRRIDPVVWDCEQIQLLEIRDLE